MRLRFRGRPTRSVVLGTILLSLSLPTAMAQKYSPEANEGYVVESNLASMLQSTPIKQQEVLSQALRIVHSMESAPTCNRLAALNLINDCKSLEQTPSDSKSDSDVVLDEVKSEYAARLAVCELLGAKATVPRECAILVPSPQACIKSRFSYFFSRQENPKGEYCYPEASHAQFERCLRALESRPQSWTSYSNARQNAVVMCHASRDAIEREKDLAIYKSLTEVVDHMASMLASSMQDMQTWVTEQMRFAEKIRLSQDQAVQEMQTRREMTLSTFEAVKNSLQSFKGMMAQAAEALTQGLDETLERSRSSIEEVREDMQNLYKDMAKVSSQHSVAQNKQLQLNHETALASLQLNHEAAVYSLNTLSNSIGTLQDKVDVSSGNVETLNQSLASLNKTIESLGSATEILRTTIDTTTESIQTLATLGGMAANPKLWLAVAACVVGLWNANRVIAGYFVMVCGLLGLLYILGIQEWFKVLWGYAKHLQIPPLQPLTAFVTAQSPATLLLPGVAVICILSVVLWSFVDSVYLYKYQDDQGEKGVLPRVETPGHPATPPPRQRYRFNPFLAMRSKF